MGKGAKIFKASKFPRREKKDWSRLFILDPRLWSAAIKMIQSSARR